MMMGSGGSLRRRIWLSTTNANPFKANLHVGEEGRGKMEMSLSHRSGLPKRRSEQLERRVPTVSLVVARSEEKRGVGILCSSPKKMSLAVRIAQLPRSSPTPVEMRSVGSDLPPSRLMTSSRERIILQRE
ncbi:unnamed protein product [Linum trigynum]|uniref:Uncharacterized protein n=1 Tax=Linum trigynum TaxID=586398 RepID=A0AAV2FXS9_9ROSI